MSIANNQPAAFAGQTYRFEVDNGYVFLNTYSASGDSLRWEAIEGPTTGQSETVALFVAELAPRVYFVSRAEKSTDMSVSHILDLNSLTVRAFWTYPTNQGRTGELHSGVLKALPSDPSHAS